MTRLRECRENAGLSQKYVALSLGVAAPSVANWERGKTRPTQENIVKLADLYKVTVDYLLERSDERIAQGHQTDLSISDIDFALSGEIRVLSEAGKMDVLQFARFIHEKEAKERAAHDD